MREAEVNIQPIQAPRQSRPVDAAEKEGEGRERDKPTDCLFVTKKAEKNIHVYLPTENGIKIQLSLEYCVALGIVPNGTCME